MQIKKCLSCGEDNNPAFTKCHKCNMPLGESFKIDETGWVDGNILEVKLMSGILGKFFRIRAAEISYMEKSFFISTITLNVIAVVLFIFYKDKQSLGLLIVALTLLTLQIIKLRKYKRKP